MTEKNNNILTKFQEYMKSKGYSYTTQNNKQSTIYDYSRSLKQVAAWHEKTIEELFDSIFDICPLYQTGNLHEIRGRLVSRSIRNSLKVAALYMSETQNI